MSLSCIICLEGVSKSWYYDLMLNPARVMEMWRDSKQESRKLETMPEWVETETDVVTCMLPAGVGVC